MRVNPIENTSGSPSALIYLVAFSILETYSGAGLLYVDTEVGGNTLEGFLIVGAFIGPG